MNIQRLDVNEKDLRKVIAQINLVLEQIATPKEEERVTASKEVVVQERLESNSSTRTNASCKTMKWGRATASTTKNNTTFIDVSDNVLKHKDDAGVVHLLY